MTIDDIEKLLGDAFKNLTPSQIKMLSNVHMGLPILHNSSHGEVKKLDITFTINIINI